MLYQNQPVEVLSSRSTFGKAVSQIKILSTGRILDVLTSELQESASSFSSTELVFRSSVTRIRNEIAQQNLLSPLESNIIPLPHRFWPWKM